MKLVVDANILFAGLIKGEGFTRKLLENTEHELYAPEVILAETNKYLEYLCNKARVDKKQLKLLLNILLHKARICIIKTEEFIAEVPETIKVIPDIDDVAYIALALKLKCGLWSNDKKLKEQNVVNVYSTEEISRL